MTLWRLAALCPANLQEERVELDLQLREWHIKTIEKVSSKFGLCAPPQCKEISLCYYPVSSVVSIHMSFSFRFPPVKSGEKISWCESSSIKKDRYRGVHRFQAGHRRLSVDVGRLPHRRRHFQQCRAMPDDGRVAPGPEAQQGRHHGTRRQRA